jgi:hypothetical protein
MYWYWMWLILLGVLKHKDNIQAESRSWSSKSSKSYIGQYTKHVGDISVNYPCTQLAVWLVQIIMSGGYKFAENLGLVYFYVKPANFRIIFSHILFECAYFNSYQFKLNKFLNCRHVFFFIFPQSIRTSSLLNLVRLSL